MWQSGELYVVVALTHTGLEEYKFDSVPLLGDFSKVTEYPYSLQIRYDVQDMWATNASDDLSIVQVVSSSIYFTISNPDMAAARYGSDTAIPWQIYLMLTELEGRGSGDAFQLWQPGYIMGNSPSAVSQAASEQTRVSVLASSMGYTPLAGQVDVPVTGKVWARIKKFFSKAWRTIKNVVGIAAPIASKVIPPPYGTVVAGIGAGVNAIDNFINASATSSVNTSLVGA